MENQRGNSIAIACLIGFAAASVTARAQEASCKPVVAAMKKYVTTPNHTFVTQTGAIADGKTLGTETLYAGSTRYILAEGRWIITPMGTADMLEKVDDTTRKSQCRLLREELLAGEATELYSVQNQSESSKTDNQIWVSKRSGLVVKEESTMMGTVGAGTSHMSLRVDYSNVQAPANAKKFNDH